MDVAEDGESKVNVRETENVAPETSYQGDTDDSGVIDAKPPSDKLSQHLITDRGNEHKTSEGITNGKPVNSDFIHRRSPPASPTRMNTDQDNVPLKEDEGGEKFNFIQVAKKKHIVEKLIFLIAVTSLLIWAYCLFSIHWLLPYYYTVAMPVLVGIRIYLYWNKKWQCFLLDFCYFGNTLCMIFIWALPDHDLMFCIVFSLANGPLLWAIPVFRNSLVFHSLDKMTSVLIHLLPSYLSFGLRWYPSSISQHWYKSFVQNHIDGSFIWLLAVPLGCYIAHGLLYFLIVHLIIRPSDEYLNTYRYLTGDTRSIFYKITNIFGTKYQIYMFYICSWLCCLGTLLLCRLWYEFFIAHVVLLSSVFVVMVWNGASYYMDVFAVKGFKADPFSSV